MGRIRCNARLFSEPDCGQCWCNHWRRQVGSAFILAVPLILGVHRELGGALLTVLCLVDIVAFYSSTIFVQASSSKIAALLISWGFGMTMFIFAIPAHYTIDHLAAPHTPSRNVSEHILDVASYWDGLLVFTRQ